MCPIKILFLDIMGTLICGHANHFNCLSQVSRSINTFFPIPRRLFPIPRRLYSTLFFLSRRILTLLLRGRSHIGVAEEFLSWKASLFGHWSAYATLHLNIRPQLFYSGQGNISGIILLKNELIAIYSGRGNTYRGARPQNLWLFIHKPACVCRRILNLQRNPPLQGEKLTLTLPLNFHLRPFPSWYQCRLPHRLTNISVGALYTFGNEFIREGTQRV